MAIYNCLDKNSQLLNCKQLTKKSPGLVIIICSHKSLQTKNGRAETPFKVFRAIAIQTQILFVTLSPIISVCDSRQGWEFHTASS